MKYLTRPICFAFGSIELECDLDLEGTLWNWLTSEGDSNDEFFRGIRSGVGNFVCVWFVSRGDFDVFDFRCIVLV